MCRTPFCLLLIACYLATLSSASTECINGTAVTVTEPSSMPEFLRWTIIVFLVMMSGMFSGLTLGLLGLDKLSMEVVMESGEEKQKEYIKKIITVREDGNRLLCTLLLGNVAVNAALSILLAAVAGGTVGFGVSTAVIVIFGEIIPQAVCSRHPLPIGAYSAPLVRVMMFIMYPVTKPIAFILDQVLGQEMAAKYSKQELAKLIDIQKTKHNVLTPTESRILEGALHFKEQHVDAVMTKLERVEMLEVNEKFDFAVLFRLFKCGHSRIPVFEEHRTNIVGLVFVKDLILLNPEDSVPVKTMMDCHAHPPTVYDDTTLDTMLSNFNTWHIHLALVMKVEICDDKDPVPVVSGIVTLEDVIEELIKEELVDETDMFVSNDSMELVTTRDDTKSLMQMFNSRVSRGSVSLSEQEALAVHQFLEKAYPDLFGFPPMRSGTLQQLLTSSDVVSVMEKRNNKEDFIFVKDEILDVVVVVLQGHCDIISGVESFQTRVGPFSVVGKACLSRDDTVFCDFTARVTGPLRYIRITKDQYRKSLIGRDVGLGNDDEEEDKDFEGEALLPSRTTQSSEMGRSRIVAVRFSPNPQDTSIELPDV